MAKVFIEETTLTAIGDAIREKEGTSDLIPVTDMSTRISAIETGGGGDLIPEEAFTITKDSKYKFAYNNWNWFIENYRDKITTNNLRTLSFMFCNSSKLTEVPFQLNVVDGLDFNQVFNGASALTVCPKIRGTVSDSVNLTFDGMLESTHCLRNIDDLFTDEMLSHIPTIKVTGQFSAYKVARFKEMYSLRTVPSWLFHFRLNEESTSYPYNNSCLYYNLFNNCHSLSEVNNLPVLSCTAAQTSNMFSAFMDNCNRLSAFTFETHEDGTPKTTKWSGQIIDLARYAGYCSSSSYCDRITNYNSGITADKEVTDDTSYQALKNDPDWFTKKPAYSRYNHDSAVATINSLPDTSAYLATAGGTNTIKFKGDSGSKTDGGAINTLTEEEIAVATAKGWTVTLV